MIFVLRCAVKNFNSLKLSKDQIVMCRFRRTPSLETYHSINTKIILKLGVLIVTNVNINNIVEIGKIKLFVIMHNLFNSME